MGGGNSKPESPRWFLLPKIWETVLNENPERERMAHGSDPTTEEPSQGHSHLLTLKNALQ